jgi:hypothetical protein
VKSDFIEFIGNARRKRSEKFRNQLYIFLVCLVLSVFFWVLVRLSKDYYYTVHYNLIYSEIPANLRMVAVSDTTLSLKIKVQGFDLFSEKFLLSHNKEFEVSLHNVRLHYSGDQVRGYLLANRIGREIVSQYNFPSDVFFVSPDTLFFEFEKQYIKRVQPRQVTDILKSQAERKDSLRLRSDTLSRRTDHNNPVTRKH